MSNVALLTFAASLRVQARKNPLHEAADAGHRAVVLLINAAFLRAQKAFKQSHDPDSAVAAIKDTLEVLPVLLLRTIKAGGVAGLTRLRKLKTASARSAAKSPFKMRFDAKNPEVIKWAKQHSAELIDDISETTKERINAAVAGLQSDGDFDAAWEDIARAIGSEERADVIARHETMLAANEGQRQAWYQAVDIGLLNGDEKRTWIATPDEKICDICEELDGTTAALDGEYVTKNGETFGGPPAHVQCRCTEGIQ